MSDIAEAIQLIQRTACAAEAAQILDISDPDDYYVLIAGNLHTIAKLAEPRQHVVYDLPSFCAAIDAFHKRECSVWHGLSRIVAIFDNDTRRDQCSLMLHHAEQFVALREFDAKLLDQRSFCAMLKLRLGIDESFVGQFRRLDWQHEKKAGQVSARGQDRMGVSISDEVNGVADLAAELVLEIPVYDLPNLPYRYKIACHVEIDAPQQKLSVNSKPDAIKSAVDQAQFDLGKLLENSLNGRLTDGETDGNRTPIFFGLP